MSRFFYFYILIFCNVTLSDLGTPHGVSAPFRKSWIHHWYALHTCMHVHGNALHSICIDLETLLEYYKILFLKLYLKLHMTRYRLKCDKIVHVSIHFSNVQHFLNMDGQNINMNRVSCQFCFFDHTDPKRVILHMLNKHSKDATFTVKCVVKDCMYSTKT